MMTINSLRDTLIDNLLAISDKEYLQALNQLVENSAEKKNIVELTGEQVAMLKMSDLDLKSGKLIENDDLNNTDLLWLKSL